MSEPLKSSNDNAVETAALLAFTTGSRFPQPRGYDDEDENWRPRSVPVTASPASERDAGPSV